MARDRARRCCRGDRAAPAAALGDLRDRRRVTIYAFCNFGELHGDDRLVHPWEQYHFFLGSKYLRRGRLLRSLQRDDPGRPRRHASARWRAHDARSPRFRRRSPVERALADARRVRARVLRRALGRLRGRLGAPVALAARHGPTSSPTTATAARRRGRSSRCRSSRLFGCSRDRAVALATRSTSC